MAQEQPLFGFRPVTNVSTPVSKGTIDTSVKVQEKPFDFLGVMRGVQGVLQQPTAEKNAADAHVAMMESDKFVTSIDHMDGTNKVAAIEKRIKEEAAGDYSSGYRSGSLAVLDKAYTYALNQQEEERVASGLNVAASTWIANLTSGYAEFPNADSATEELANSFSLNKAQVRDALYTGTYAYYAKEAMKAPNDDELTNVMNEFSEVVSHNFKDNTFFEGSKAKAFNSIVNEAKNNLNTTVQARRKYFSDLEQEKVEISKGDGLYSSTSYIDRPEVFRWDIAYRDPDVRQKQRQAYTNKYTMAQEARSIMASVQVLGPKINLESISLKDNTFLQKEYPMYIAQVGLQKFQNGNTESTVDVMYNSPVKAQEEFGSAILQTYRNSATTDQIEPLINKIEDMYNTNGGATVMNQAVTPKEFGRMMLTIDIAKQQYGGDLEKARHYVNQQDRVTTKASWDDELFATVSERSTELGVHGSRYKAAMELYNKIDPAWAAKNEDKIATYYSNLQEETNGILWDTSVANYFNTNQVPEPDVLKQRIADSFLMTTGIEPTRIQALHNNGFIAFDDVTGISHVLSMDMIMQEHDSWVMGKAEFTGRLPISEELYSVATDIGSGLSTSIGKLGGRFGDYLKQQTIKDWEKLKALFVVDVNTSGLRPEDKFSVEQAVERNKTIQRRIDSLMLMQQEGE